MTSTDKDVDTKLNAILNVAKDIVELDPKKQSNVFDIALKDYQDIFSSDDVDIRIELKSNHISISQGDRNYSLAVFNMTEIKEEILAYFSLLSEKAKRGEYICNGDVTYI